jgi:hypothetical protein
MRKEKTKQLVDVMRAYVNGKTIQYYAVDYAFKIKHPGEPNFKNKWVDVDEEHIFRPDLYDYRIKPSSKYRPFRNAEECLEEMQKHVPFSWVKDKYSFYPIEMIGDSFSKECIKCCGTWFTPEKMFKDATFLDGTPFGIRENF